jgi:hypothetical protein
MKIISSLRVLNFFGTRGFLFFKKRKEKKDLEITYKSNNQPVLSGSKPDPIPCSSKENS